MMPTIDIKDVHKTYRSGGRTTAALVDVNLSLRQNEFVTLVGPSGCGKSTLLKIIGALVKPSRGVVTYDGQTINRPQRNVGIAFQEPALLPWRSVIENILLSAEILGLDMADARRYARELIALASLEGFENHDPHELSGGMQHRVAICRALITRPSILLMDEPFAALDAMTREDLALELLRIWDRDKKTVVFVTHGITEAILLADRVVAMSARPGRIAKVINVELPRPRTIDMEFTAQFKAYSDEIRSVIYDRAERSSVASAAQ
jgi:NitT/TauT family transport system ATP-binding protein